MILYSVIIPVYNAEKTLSRCVDSLLNQNCSDAEIILVNDGSTDGSKALCQQYADSNACVRLIDQPNGGVSSARNAGLDAAQGEYVLFVDSDDYVPQTLFTDLAAYTNDNKWDLVRFSYCIDDGNTLHERRMKNRQLPDRISSLPIIIDDICRKHLNAPWAKLYRKELLERSKIRFPIGVSVAEDRSFNICYSLNVHSYAISDRIAYYVNTENEQSLSRKKHHNLEEQFRIADANTDSAIQAAEIPPQEKELYRRAINLGKCRSIYREAKDQIREGKGWRERQKYLWKRCKDINSQHMRYPKTNYCRLISLPVVMRQTWVIDSIAKRLLK